MKKHRLSVTRLFGCIAIAFAPLLYIFSIFIHEVFHVLGCLVFNIPIYRITFDQDAFYSIRLYTAVSPYSQITTYMGGLGSALVLSLFQVWPRFRNSLLGVVGIITRTVIYVQLGSGFLEGMFTQEYCRGLFSPMIILTAATCTVLTEIIRRRKTLLLLLLYDQTKNYYVHNHKERDQKHAVQCETGHYAPRQQNPVAVKESQS